MQKLSDSLWYHQGFVYIGKMKGAVGMTVVQLASGEVLLHSPVAISDERKREIDAIGPVKYIVSAVNGHNTYIEAATKLYPDATAYVSDGVPKKRPGLTNYTLLSSTDKYPWDEDLETIFLPGVPIFNERIFYHRASKSLIVSDFVQNHVEREYESKLEAFFDKKIFRKLGWDGVTTAPPLGWKWPVKDKPAFCQALERVKALDVKTIVCGHGPALDNADNKLAAMCDRLLAKLG